MHGGREGSVWGGKQLRKAAQHLYQCPLVASHRFLQSAQETLLPASLSTSGPVTRPELVLAC